MTNEPEFLETNNYTEPTQSPWHVLVDRNRHNWFEILVRFQPLTPADELRANVRLIAVTPDICDALYELSHYADSITSILKETHPGKAEALENRIAKAKELIDYVKNDPVQIRPDQQENISLGEPNGS